MSDNKCIAIFDLDGTLTYTDTFVPYLLGFLARHPWRIYRLVHLPWVVAMFFLGKLDNTRLKEHFLWAFLGGVRQATVEGWTKKFVIRLVARGIRQEALASLEQHRHNGDLLVLVSASLDIYVNEVGARLGFNQVFCTEIHWHGDRLTGHLSSLNCFGEEKVRRLLALRKSYPKMRMIAYADHESDFPLLRFVQTGILINGSPKIRCLAAQAGIDCRVWKD